MFGIRRLGFAAALFAASAAGISGATEPATLTGPCEGIDPILAGSSFVLVRTPAAGERIATGAVVSGCSRTREGTVAWRLRGRDGRELASGSATGGGFSGAHPFRFELAFDIPLAERGTLELFEPRVSEEGSLPPSTSFPLVLAAAPPRMPLFGRFLGTVPCADCAGIRVELALYGDFGVGPREYVLIETYLATKEGDRRFESRGSWLFTPGAAELERAIVVQLQTSEGGTRNYLVEGGDLIQLDRSGKKIDSPLDYRLKRQP